ncbi:MAG: Uma2 family endonuclease, partial [Chloroflexota bacterium]
MIAERKQPNLTVEEYLALEDAGSVKHEYVHGYVYAMAGGTLAHDIIANTIRAALHAHAGVGPCVVLGPDARVRVGETVYYYPDAVVVCGEILEDRALEVTVPRLLVEVLSDATENADRGDKFADYQTLASLAEYLRRCSMGTRTSSSRCAGAALLLSALCVSMPVARAATNNAATVYAPIKAALRNVYTPIARPTTFPLAKLPS